MDSLNIPMPQEGKQRRGGGGGSLVKFLSCVWIDDFTGIDVKPLPPTSHVGNKYNQAPPPPPLLSCVRGGVWG